MLEPPRDLTLPEGSSATVRRILGQALRRLLTDLRALPLAGASPPVAAALRSVLRATFEELSREPGRVLGALRRPNVGAAVRVLRGLRGAARERIDAVASQLACTLALELAASGAELPPLRFSGAPERVVCLGGRFVAPGGSVELVEGRWTSPAGRFDLTRPDQLRALREPPSFHPIAGSIVLACADDNPLAMVEAHPDKEGNAVDLGGREPSEWCETLRRALDVIGAHLPALRDEADLVLHQVVPVGYFEREHLSASYQESIGSLYLSLHPRLLTMVEAVVHELSHNKLNALFELDPVLHNAFTGTYASPVRPDPRPLHGILLAVHAFLPVAALYRSLLRSSDPVAARAELERRYRQLVRLNRDGVEVLLEHADPSPAGRALLDEIRRLDASFGA